MTEITDSIRPLYRPRAEVHAELAATVERPRYVSEDADDALNDASVWLAIFGLAAVFVWVSIFLGCCHLRRVPIQRLPEPMKTPTGSMLACVCETCGEIERCTTRRQVRFIAWYGRRHEEDTGVGHRCRIETLTFGPLVSIK
jgi:hypothetical protein